MKKEHSYILPVIVFSIILGVGGIIIKIMEYKILFYPSKIKWYLGFVGVIFLVIGFYISKLIYDKQKLKKEKRKLSHAYIDLTEREFEVLVLIAKGYSNREIADQLFLSIPTIKTHASNLFTKLDVQRRTQAVKRAKELNLID